MNNMAIVRATYTRNKKGAKASVRYIEHRPGKEGSKINRILFGRDGAMGRWQAYHLIEQAAEKSIYFRFVISPDPKAEDSNRDLHLREVTEKTMHALEDRFDTPIHWVAAEHNDHAPHRHVHVIAVVPGKLQVSDFALLRKSATEACLQQRRERDLARAQQAQTQEPYLERQQ